MSEYKYDINAFLFISFPFLKDTHTTLAIHEISKGGVQSTNCLINILSVEGGKEAAGEYQLDI